MIKLVDGQRLCGLLHKQTGWAYMVSREGWGGCECSARHSNACFHSLSPGAGSSSGPGLHSSHYGGWPTCGHLCVRNPVLPPWCGFCQNDEGLCVVGQHYFDSVCHCEVWITSFFSEHPWGTWCLLSGHTPVLHLNPEDSSSASGRRKLPVLSGCDASRLWLKKEDIFGKIMISIQEFLKF